MNVKGKQIFVGLSGGVDSAVSAALLKEAGAEVTGVFIKGWYPPGMPCSWAEDRRDAMRIAARLHIPFVTLDASAAYKKSVIDYLLAEYCSGRTPNPDVMCNRDIKFGVFYDYAKAHGADAIATGHYRSGEKDQSYFLWAVPRHILETTVFPVGQKDKHEVRMLARKLNLPVAEKPDSQGVCFLGSISVEEFLRQEIGTHQGVARDGMGNHIGTHEGALLYTLGERVRLTHAPQGPWFVLAKDVEKNELVVRRGSTPVLTPGSIAFTGSNWLVAPKAATHAQLRYRGPYVAGSVEGETFVPREPMTEVPTPGQSIVFYQGRELVGGGIIEP